MAKGPIKNQTKENILQIKTNEKGRAVPDGTYFYIINLGGEHDPIKGTITIIR